MATDEFKELLSRAFEAARQAGKRDWHRMTVAVLKNRLLQMTERRFDEKNYGAESFIELVARCSDLVRIDKTTKPQTVEWRQASQAAADVSPAAMRVRSDLWKAILDYSSGREYEWDPASGQARPVAQAEPSRRLPTVDREKFGEWRTMFAEEQEASLTDPVEAKRLSDWASSGLGTQYLPRDLQGAWNATLKNRVVDLLSSWFESSTFVPPNILAPVAPSFASSLSADLRTFVHQCVDAMSTDELRALQFPAQVLLRVARQE